MDIRQYYSKQRAIYDSLESELVVIVSNATADGGREGLKSEVSRRLAAKLIAEDRARAATKEEAAAFRRGANAGRTGNPKR